MTDARNRPPAGVLDGVRVLDFTAFVAGPYCTRLMADLGAEVLKFEPPEGDLLRTVSPLRDGHSAYFGQINCGKKSLVLDLKRPAAVDLARRLAATTDVVVENFRPGVMARLGLGYPALSAVKPDLVYCSISGYGQSGPAARDPAFAPIIHAASGYELAQLDYQTDRERPARGRPITADVLGAVHAVAAINAALFDRHRRSKGHYIDVALMDSMQSILPFEFQQSQLSDPDRHVPIYAPIKTLDGFIVIMPVTDKNFENLAHALDRSDWLEDPRFAVTADRIRHWHELAALIEEWAGRRTSGECERILGPSGCPFARYVTIAEARRAPQVAARGALIEAQDAAGRFVVPDCPFRFAEAEARVKPRVPALGEHGSQALADWLGLSPAEIKALKGAGVVRGA